MIYDEICTYEVAKLVKEKGFNEYVDTFYAENCNTPHSQGPEKWNDYDGRYAAPTQSLLQRWLREEKGLHIEISVSVNDKHCFYWALYSKGCDCWEEVVMCSDEYATYELALEDALKYALKNLI